jgi:SNF2 family DNA or RNA helicase
VRIALTGTPVENHLGDLWSIFDFINPGLLGNAKQFGQN